MKLTRTLKVLPLITASLMFSYPIASLAQNNTDKIIAVVNDTPILQSQLDSYIASKPEVLKITDDKDVFLKQLINRQLVEDVVKKTNVNPPAVLVNKQLLDFAKLKGADSIEELKKTLDKQNPYLFAKIRKEIANEIAIKLLGEKEINERIKLTEKDIDAFLASPEGLTLNDNKYETVHIRVPFPNSLAELNSEQLMKARQTAKHIESDLRYITDNSNESVARLIAKHQSHYSEKIVGGNMGYNKANDLPINLATKITKLSPNQVHPAVTTQDGIDVIKLVSKKVPDGMLVPQWRTRHILVSVNRGQNNSLAKSKVDMLYKKLNEGYDFAKLAAKHSNDPGSAGSGGDLNWVSEGVMVSEFEKAMKSTPIGTYSKPFRTEFGWHILENISKRSYDSSNDVRRQIAREILFKRMAPQASEDWINELRSKAYIQRF